MKRNCLAGLGVVFLCLLLVGGAAAQSDRGTIAGSVLDSSGAAVGGAAVTVTGEDTGTVYKTASTADGVYRVSDIAVGRYDVNVEAQGFKASLQKGVLIQINTVTALNVTLQPGDVKEEVTVLADAPTLQTESSDQGTVVGTKQIEELPLSLATSSQSFLRSPETFVFLTPGTTGPGTVAAAGNNGIFLSKLAGGQNLGAEILLDGASVQRQDTVSAFDQTAPSVEALNEFKVTTATPTAQFGRTSGGIESFTTRSGTNSYHGTVFDIFRNQALDANSWDNDFVGAKKPSDHQNDFGGSLGGPVRIPHVYDGHNKTFFFFSWEQYRNKPGTTSVSTVPTQAERGGDFSAVLGADTGIPNPCTPGQNVLKGQIFDPSTTRVVGGQTCRSPFSGNKFTNISTVAQNVLQYVPLPNAPGTENGLVNNFIFNSSDPKIETTMTFRIDESVTDKNKMFFSYSSREQNQLNNIPSIPGPADGTYRNRYLTHYLRYGWDYLASPSLLNHFVVGLNRLNTASIGSSVNGTDWPKKLGIGNAFGQVFPTFQFNGSPQSINYLGLSAGNDDYHYPNSLVFADSVSWTKGRHSLRFGGELRFFQFSVLAGGNTSPNYVFQNYQTAWHPNDTTPLTGDPFASFLLGLPQSESLTVNSHFPRWNQRYYALYVQDDFKFRRNLTLNLGLRWDVDTPRHEASGAQSVLSLTASNPATPGFSGALIFGKNATGTSTYLKDIGPRVGFAWSPDFVRDTVVRGAYSIYYAPVSYSDFGAFLTSGTSVNPSFTSGDNFTPVQSLDAGFPAYTPPSNNQDPTLLNFSQNGVNTVLPSYGGPGMVQNWDLEIQHQIMQDLILSIGYVGQHATRLNSGLAQVNTINPKYNSLGANLGLLVTDPNAQPILASLGVTVPSWFIPGWSTGANASPPLDTIGNLLRPFPQFGDINTNCCLENLGQSTYNALQAKLERRFRNGLNLLASYTYSKTITDADGSYPFFSNLTSNVFGSQNPFNLRAEKAVSYQDVPHTFVLSYLYELPVGPGKRYLSHGVASKVLGGWQVGGVQRYQSGSPVLINEFATGLPGGSGGQYPGANYRYSLMPGQSLFVNHPARWTPALESTWNSSCTGGPNPGTFIQGTNPPPNATSNPVMNCAGFLDPSAASLAAGGGYVYGNLPQIISSWRSPAYFNEDFSIIKRTTIRESHEIVFKLDIPNAFNRHVFGQVDGNIGDRHFGVPGFGNFAGIPTVVNGARQIQATLRYEF